ncbi:cytochrome b5-like Heme/Steroid binding domain-containing protein [Dactylonectria estremocensis]|uniref:NADPH--hemoprotein reductase n=1 Tax=Dactylonectria estremocensis TaxID=1079267 RepID=A0A9P9EY74_9HYPO|nr:cytochrome b5-like Heme/Steroid binding domain-containing protein [Dactylonectria estremocensis]
MSVASCPVSGSMGGMCPVGGAAHCNSASTSRGPRGCSFSGTDQPGDIHAAFDIPRGVDVEEWLRMRERKSINQILYSNYPSRQDIDNVKDQKELDNMNANEHDVLAVALGAPARQVMRRAEEIGPQTGWRDGYLSMEHGFCPVDYEEAAGALSRSPGRIWSNLCERMPGCSARGRVREAVATLPIVEGTEEVIPDQALWAAVVVLGMLCSIYRFEEKYDGTYGVFFNKTTKWRPNCPMGDDLCEELRGIPRSIALPYYQVSRRMGRTLPHLSFPDQASYNIKIKDPKSSTPYLGRFDNMDLRWPVFGERAEIAFLKGCADTSASFQHGPDAIAACQEHVMTNNVEGLLRELIRLKEILERMPNAFHTISPNPNAGDNYVSADRWVRWALFSAPLSRRVPASSGLQFPPYLVMDAFLGRKRYGSFLGAEGVHLRAWFPSNLRAFIAAIEYHYRIPEFVAKSGDPRLMGVLDGVVEAYTGERGFMGVHRYKVFGILEIAAKTGRTETNGLSGAGDSTRPWEETHKQFSDAMKERLEPYRGELAVEPHQMRGTFEECRYASRVAGCHYVDSDPKRSIALVTLDIQDSGITFQPGDRMAVMPLNGWDECAKMAAALGLEHHIDDPIVATGTWSRFEQHLASVRRSPVQKLTVTDILRRGHVAPITKELALKVHEMLHASSNTVLQILATEEWPVSASLGDLLQEALTDTPLQIWDKAFNLDNLSWLADLVELEVPRTYSIASYSDDLLPSTVDLAISRAEYKLCPTFSRGHEISRAGVSSGFFNPYPMPDEVPPSEEILIGLSRPVAFQLPIDQMAPCAYFAGGSGIAPFRSFWQNRLLTSGLLGGKNFLYLGVQSREKFCFEEELRELVKLDFMQVHVAFSRDSQGLVHDPVSRELVERQIPPRYIDTLIVEQGANIGDLVMSKKQGGLGGYLYICGSVAVFDSVMNGIRKALYTYRTATMENVDMIVNKAFAERRFMLDVFMTPKPLPCNLPTIPMSVLAQHTGHSPGSRMWIGVHGSVYDITDFCPMHPGGTLIIKSNAGVDCSESFDNLAHTNNPEVSSLLTRYFVGHLTPKPDYHANPEMSSLHDLWASYLRTIVETLVAHQFEMYEIMGASINESSDRDNAGTMNIWVQEGLPNIIAVRTFYAYQSRLLQGGFAALFGPKLQELVLKLSFSVASASGVSTEAKLPDILGTITRAKTGMDAASCTKEVSLIGEFVSDPESSLRFQERGVFAYATKSVELDIGLLEDIRQEACNGMDAFDTIAATFGSSNSEDAEPDTAQLSALSVFLLQTLERMARRLDVFYSQLARVSVYQPDLEHNPARTRWALVRKRMRDGSLFVLAHKAAEDRVLASAQSTSYYMSRANPNQNIDFDKLLHQVNEMIGQAKKDIQRVFVQPTTVNAIQQARGRTADSNSLMASRPNAGSLQAMTNFMETNKKAIRRLSRIPPGSFNLEDLQNAAAQFGLESHQEQPGIEPYRGTPASMGHHNTHRTHHPHHTPVPHSATPFPHARDRSRSTVSRNRSPRMSFSSLNQRPMSRSRQSSLSRSSSPGGMAAGYPVIGAPPTPPTEAQIALLKKMSGLNTRPDSHSMGHIHSPIPSFGVAGTRAKSVVTLESAAARGQSQQHARGQSTGWLRSFKLRSLAEQSERVAPTF